MVFVAVVVVVLLTEAGYDEVNDVRNWKYDRYFLTLGNILRILLSLRKNDENDSVFSSFHHIDITAMHLRQKKRLMHWVKVIFILLPHTIDNKIETWSKEN